MFVWRNIDKVSGGVERMSAAMMNEMIKREHEVSFLTWDHEDATAYYKLSPEIKWFKLGIGDPTIKGNWKTRFQRMFKVRKIVKQDNPDVIFCFESGVFFSTKMFLLGYNIPIISAERNAPSRHKYSSNPKQKYSIFTMLSLADKITVQFDRYKESYPRFLRSKMVAIHNPVKPVSESADPQGQKNNPKILLCVARLAYQKNIDVLVDTFIELEKDYPNWILRIAGDGEKENYFKQKIEQLNLANRIEILGAVSDVASLYKSSHLFCITSRYEGFPNALAEAQSYGLPAVGYAECCGVRDLIKDNISGLLADGNGDKNSLKEALSTLMTDDKKRQKMGIAAKKSMGCYQPTKIFDQWESFFKNIVNSKK